MIDVDKIRELIEEAAPLPWYYDGYSTVFSKEMLQVHDDFWNEERMNDGHTYDHRVGKVCDACGPRYALTEGGAKKYQMWDCAFSSNADEVEAVAAKVDASYGDTATGWRAKNAQLIEEGLNALPELLEMHDRHVKMCAELGFCPRDGDAMPCMTCGAGL